MRLSMLVSTLKELAEMCEGHLINTEEDFQVQKVSIDTRAMNGAQIYIPIVGERFDGHSFIDLAFKQGALVSLFQKDFDHSMFKSPLILVDDTNKALGILAKNYLKKIGAKVIGITGSNGKTSTKDILHTLLSDHFKVEKTKGNFNNEIGLPLTILAMPEDTEIAVLEMGMSSLGEIKRLTEIAPCDIGIITSIGNAHLSDLGSLDNIIEAKLEITNNLTGPLIINGDNKPLLDILKTKTIPNDVITYGFNPTNQIQVESVTQFVDGIVFSADRLYEDVIEANLLGRFQALNITAALLVVRELGLELESVIDKLKELELTGNRNEVSIINEAVIIDDSYKSNPESLRSALDLLNTYQYDSMKIAVIGDMLDLGPDEVKFHQNIGTYLEKLDIDRIYTIGKLGKYFHSNNSIIGEHFDNQDDLLRSLKPWLKQPSTILVKASNSLKLNQLVEKLKKEEKRMKVAVIFGGKSKEYEVSLSSAYSTLQNFPHDQYELVMIGIAKDGSMFTGDYKYEEIENDTWMNNPTSREIIIKPGNQSRFMYLDNMNSFRVDIAFNMIHGKQGEDGVLQAMLMSGGIKYTGCDQQSSILCYDKDITHRLLDNTDIKKAKYRTLTQLIKESEYHDLADYLGQKMIIKPAREGSSYGISVADNYSDFFDGLQKALQYDTKVVIEQFIEGFEIGCAVLEENKELHVGECDEIEIKSDFFDYEGKYEFKDAQIILPARIDQETSNKTKELAKKVFKHLGCRDFARVDFFVGKDNEVYFNEINTIPGFTSHSRFPSMMNEVGIPYKEIIKILIDNARRRND